MEVKINREIRDYTESMFFGLSLRQLIFSLVGIITAIVIYFCLKDYFGIEILSWVCIVGATPFAILGFITYHGMTAEQLIWTWIKSELINPKELTFIPENIYYEAMRENIFLKDKEKYKNND